MPIDAQKISFNDAWNSTSIFFVDNQLENEIDQKVDSLLEIAKDPRISEKTAIDANMISDLLREKTNSLDVVLKDIELSEEKFMRIVTLLRKIGRIPGGFDVDNVEWNMQKIKNFIIQDNSFTETISQLLVEGKYDQGLSQYIPRYYLDKLNYREIQGSPQAARRIRYKGSLIGTYGGRKGYQVEKKVKEKLEEVKDKYGIPYSKGRSRFIDTDIDHAIPIIDDPWVIIMCSFQETTSSGQTTKTRDMLSAYVKVIENNSRNRENRVFVNFIDGGGWLARKRDFERLVSQCHYFINLNYLDMLESIILKHVPTKYFNNSA
ncbi:MAG: hypothetical protein JW908_06725 [Anaerolineales bacterium]|nr:hypothetical protein [Anaerolineales bacterium]